MKLYTATHEWVELKQDGAYVGISAHAAEELGEIVYVELPEVGAKVSAGQSMCELESVKAVAEVNAPVDGTVVKVNDELSAAPEKAGEEWICVLAPTSLPSDLMDEAAYKAFLG